jgi:thioredoxin reductase (NADPH)
MNELKYAVVCVDDDPYILQMLGFQLSKIVDQKFTLIEYYTDPKIALASIGELIEDAIQIIFLVVDYQMPQMTGVEFIRSIKTRYPYLKCVMLSGEANKISVEELIKDNLLESFVGKPWDEEVLFDALRPILAQHS